MKKNLLRTLCIMIGFCLLTFSAVSASVIEPGYFGLKYSDFTYTDFDYANLFPDSGLPYHPGQDLQNITNNVWGITALTSSHTLLDSNIENNLLGQPAYYNNGDDGNYYYGVYGGLTIDYISGSGGAGTQIYLTATAEGAYLKIYELDAADANAYNLDWAAGPNVAGEGVFGTFGQNIISNGTLFLDLAFSPGTLQAYDASGLAIYTDLEIITLSSSVTGSAESYMDVIGGTGASLIGTGGFPLGDPNFPDRADLKIISDLTADFNGITGLWRGDWTTTSQDPITGFSPIPEPSTFILLGCGLLGLVFCARRKRSQ
jgi:hypothetical protein